MKKFAKILLMLTCVFVLTACSSSETPSEFQLNKESAARSRADQVVNLTMTLVSQNDVNEMLADYSNVELGDLFASTYAQYYGDSSFMCEGKAVNSALTSFKKGIDSMGAITEFGASTSHYDNDTIVVMIPVKGENGNGSVELIFTNDIYLQMTSCTLNLDETMGGLMTKAALNTLLGMGTVFVVLILISFIISAFGFLPKLQTSKKVETAPTPVPAPAAPVVEEEEEDLSDDMELVAVIAAAIASYEGTSVEGFQVRSIRRADTKNWKRA